MANHRYKESLWLEAKRLFVEQEMPTSSISKHFGGRPTKAAIDLHAKKVNPKTGQNWYDLRRNFIELKMIQMSPESMRNKILQKLWLIVNDENTTPGAFSDQVSKIQKFLKDIMHPSNQVPVMFWLLEDYARFCQKHFPGIVNQDFVDSLRTYKDHIRAEKLGL